MVLGIKMSETFSKIKVMISSTVKDMYPDRDAVMQVFRENFFFVELLGVEPIGHYSIPRSPYIGTLEWAEDSDFFILLLGSRYGYEIKNNMSATEAEFEAAYRKDPTKIIIFQEANITPNEKQAKFIKKVEDYFKGFFITKYKDTHELKEIVRNSFLNQLKERMSLGSHLTYFDHFIRLAITRKPFPHVNIYYSVTDKDIELKYKYPKKERYIYFSKKEIYKDFWGCMAKLEHIFDRWSRSYDQ